MIDERTMKSTSNSVDVLSVVSLISGKCIVPYIIKKGKTRRSIVFKNFYKNSQMKFNRGMYALIEKGEITNHRIERIFNSLLNNSKANADDVLGSMSQLKEEFFQSLNPKDLLYKTDMDLMLEWEEFYKRRMPGAILKAAKIMVDYQRKKDADEVSLKHKSMPTEKEYENLEQNCITYVEHLVYYNSFKGFVCERSIIAFLAKYLNLPWKKVTVSEDKKGTDGYVGKYKISVKPINYRQQNIKSPVDGFLIYYEKQGDDLIFYVYEEEIKNKLLPTKKGIVETISLIQIFTEK